MSKLLHNVSILTVTADQAGQRLDNFLVARLKNVPKSRIYKMLRKGEVRVNKKRAAPLYKLQPNDVIRIPPYWAEEAPVTNKPNKHLTSKLLAAIIYEDDKLMVINKPEGIASHGGSGINFGVIETLRHARPDIHRLELVHRLDRDTSGCLVLAKKNSSLRQLHELIRAGLMTKKYLLLVRGQWQGGERRVAAGLQKNQLRSGERMVKVDAAGKESVTIFRPIEIGNEVSLLEAELKTGRTHQIRVHAAHIGYPIVGDDKYGDKEFNKIMAKNGMRRLCLHAHTIGFSLPGALVSQFHVQAPINTSAKPGVFG